MLNLDPDTFELTNELDLSVIIPTLNEGENIAELLSGLRQILTQLDLAYELIVIDGGSRDGTVDAVHNTGLPVLLIQQESPFYGEALRQGFERARGEFIVTLDADLSHPPSVIQALWAARSSGDVIIASRYVEGGRAEMPFIRLIMSRILNLCFSKGLSIPVRDMSSGFRLYRSSPLRELKLTSRHFDVLEEILIGCFAAGRQIAEIPMNYRPRRKGKSKAKLAKFAIAFGSTFLQMWKLRNSIRSGDYDSRAFDSWIIPQRYWQRRRYEIITRLAKNAGHTLDVGCGSSRILGGLDSVVGLDILLPKLRHARKFGRPLVNGSIFALPFEDENFDCVVCSEVIEHIPAGEIPFLELRRVLRPGGVLILGTPDYAHASWRIIESLYRLLVPGGYADEHITQYSLASLKELLEKLGFAVIEVEYILNSEMILKCELTTRAKQSKVGADRLEDKVAGAG